MKKILDDHDQRILRESNVITDSEIVYMMGDIYVAENVISGEKRQIQVNNILKEHNNKRVLKG